MEDLNGSNMSSDVVWGIPEEEEEEDEDEIVSNEEVNVGEEEVEEVLSGNRNRWAELSVEEEETNEERDDAIFEEASNQIKNSEHQQVETSEDEESSSDGESEDDEVEVSNGEIPSYHQIVFKLRYSLIIENNPKAAVDAFVNTSTNATHTWQLPSEEERSLAKVLNRQEIVLLLSAVTRRLHLEPQERHLGRVCVGMVGYPNVGKSSVINTILGVSKASHG